jgi:hypothetical protein
MLELEESSEGEGEEGDVLLLSFLFKNTSRYSRKFIIIRGLIKKYGRVWYHIGQATI